MKYRPGRQDLEISAPQQRTPSVVEELKNDAEFRAEVHTQLHTQMTPAEGSVVEPTADKLACYLP